MVTQFLEPNDRVMEFGAGIESIRLLCARRFGSNRVQSFEANAMMEEIILGNYELNKYALPESAIGILSEESGEAVLKRPAGNLNRWDSLEA